jgi:hypothetical protein
MSSTKYQKIIEDMHRMISEKKILPGDILASISEVSRRYDVARETAVKAYKVLKQEGLIDSVPGKGFYLISDQINEVPRVLLILNSFNPYMQVLYNAYSGALSSSAVTDIYFHHNNIAIFRNLIRSYSGRYSHFIVKPFVHEEIPGLLRELDPSRLLLLDRGEYIPAVGNYLCQDFSGGFGRALMELLPLMEKYEGVHLVRSEGNPHPKESFEEFQNFLAAQEIPGGIADGMCGDFFQKKHVYIVVSDDDLVRVLALASERGWVPGEDVGILSYNDSPLLEFVSRGITSLSVDFAQMGRRAAEFIKAGKTMQTILPPQLILRRTL